MISLFGPRYRSNFCADCGNERAPARWWEHRYLCLDCAGRRGYGRRVVFTAAAVGFSLFLLAHVVRQPSMPVAEPAVSAFDAIGDRPPVPVTEERPPRVLCGARTQRGTPCRRLVAPGERCAQHKGRPSILPAEQEPDGKR